MLLALVHQHAGHTLAVPGAVLGLPHTLKYLPHLLHTVAKLLNGNGLGVVTIKYSEGPLNLFMEGLGITQVYGLKYLGHLVSYQIIIIITLSPFGFLGSQ